MNYFTCIFLLLTVAQCQSSKSPNKAEHQDVELNWIERLLLFPYCLSDCSDMIESPLELLENYDEKQTKLGTETTEVDPGLDSPEELCAETLEAVEAVEENIKSVFESNDPVEDVLAFILTAIIDYAQLGWEFISGVVNTVFQQCVAAVTYLHNAATCAYSEQTQTGPYEGFAGFWHQAAAEVALAAGKLTDTLSMVPCGAPPKNTNTWGCIWDMLDAYLSDVNGYILATFVTLIVFLAVQYIKRTVMSGSESRHKNISSNSRVKDDNFRPTKVTNTPRIDVVRKPVAVSPKKSLKSPGGIIGCQRRTKSELESREQLREQKSAPPSGVKRPPSPRPPSRPQPRLVDAGSDTMFPASKYSGVNEATDTDDLRIAVKETTQSPYAAQASPYAAQSSPAAPSCPVWIRYGSSPVKKHLESKYGRKGRASSPIWERRASTADDWKRSLLQKPRSPIRSPGKPRYVPSPIYIEEETNTSFDVDIGEPCYSSSFIEECLSESGGRSRRDSGDSSNMLRPSVITKRYTKLKTGEFNMSHANGSGDTSAGLDVSELNKSISLYTGDGMVFYELAFVYAFQNIFARIRELVRWSRWARSRRTYV